MRLATFTTLGATDDADPPRPPLPLLHSPLRPSPKGSLVAIRVMKHPATGGHALGAPRSRPQLVPTPTQSAQPLGAPPRRAPGPRPSLPGGSPGQSARPTSPQPRADPAGSESRRVPVPPPPSSESPSLSLHPASPPALPRAGQRSGAAPHAGSGESGPRPCRLRPPPRPQR